MNGIQKLGFVAVLVFALNCLAADAGNGNKTDVTGQNAVNPQTDKNGTTTDPKDEEVDNDEEVDSDGKKKKKNDKNPGSSARGFMTGVAGILCIVAIALA